MGFSAPLSAFFGGGPGWLRRVRGETFFDFREGRVSGPAGTLLRVPHSTRWVAS